MRWKLVDENPQQSLFDDEELMDRHVGRGEFAGMEFLHVNAKRIINHVPTVSRVPFQWTINAYRGCSHACSYSMAGETRILMADGRLKRLADVRVGDVLVGTEVRGRYRRYVSSQVLAHWGSVHRAHRTTLDDGTTLLTSSEHRFLSNRGWKYVTGAEHGRDTRPHLTPNNWLLGPGRVFDPPVHDPEYRAGYLCGMVRGDATITRVGHPKARGGVSRVNQFRLALADLEPLARSRHFLELASIDTWQRLFCAGSETRSQMTAIATGRKANVNAIFDLVAWSSRPSLQWAKGFLAGIFDAEGSYSRGIVRVSNTDVDMIDWTTGCLDLLRIPWAIDAPADPSIARQVRVVGGLPTHLRFFGIVDPATTRKRTFEGVAMKNSPVRRVVSIEPTGLELPMYDMTTTTGDYVAEGIISHNCFARPTHDYLGLGIGEDFDRKIVVKVNAVERTRAEVSSPKWTGASIAMGTNTDPYQRCEGKYHLTRGIVAVLGEARNPFSILTKSTLILRDLDLLQAAAARTEVHASFSIGTLDEEVWKLTEPGTPHPKRRVEAVAKLNEAGIPCGVLVAPVLPGLSDRPDQLRAVVEACADAGATSISAIPLHLRQGVRGHFFEWLAGARPDLVPMYERLYGNRSYLPKAEQAAITDLVAGLRRERSQRRPRRSANFGHPQVKMTPGGTNGQDRRSSS